jgi:glycerophosphoryl diester phosphodiesterase
MMPVIIGHRGIPSRMPENTMASFMAALGLGATGLETDVQMTKDGELVLIHDETVDRTTNGSGLVAGHTLSQLRALDAGGWFHERYAGEKIPLLSEFLAFAADKDILIDIEIKSGVVAYPGIEEKLIAMLHEYGVAHRTVLSSFNHYALLTCKQIDSTIKTGILYMCGLVDPWVYAGSIGADALHPLFYSVRPETIGGMRESGLDVYPFTVDAETDMKRLLALGVSGIITNRCDVLAGLAVGV